MSEPEASVGKMRAIRASGRRDWIWSPGGVS
jgi:hypothetical protein